MRLLFILENSISPAKYIPDVDIAMRKMVTLKVVLRQCLNFLTLKAPATSRSIVNKQGVVNL